MPETEVRYEKKFVLRGIRIDDAERVIRVNPGHFREVYPPRSITNIYFDSPFLESFKGNIQGIGKRTKTRLRWYENFFGTVKKPILEFKSRNNDIGTKSRFAVPDFVFDRGFTQRQVMGLICDLELPPDYRLHLKRCEPTLINRYRRKYYLSACGRFRLTLDFDLEYYGVARFGNLFLNRFDERHHVVLELKYEIADAGDASQITQGFSFRLSRNSKYVNGLSRTDMRYLGAYAV